MNAKITIKNTHNGLNPRPKPNIKPDDKQVLTQFSCKKKQTGTKQKPNFYLLLNSLKIELLKVGQTLKKSNSFLNIFELCQVFYAIFFPNIQRSVFPPRKLLLKTNTKCIFQINFFIFLDAGIRENFSSDFLEC